MDDRSVAEEVLRVEVLRDVKSGDLYVQIWKVVTIEGDTRTEKLVTRQWVAS